MYAVYSNLKRARVGERDGGYWREVRESAAA